MEINELKTIANREVYYSQTEIENIFEIRTKRNLSLINKKMKWDVFWMLSVTVLLISLTFFMGLKSRYIVSIDIMVLALVMGIHYRIKYHLLNQIDYQTDIYKGLLKLIKRINVYLISYRIIVPLFVWGLYIYTFNQTMTFSSGFLYISISIVVFTSVVVHLIIKAIYGNSLKKLTHMKRELFE